MISITKNHYQFLFILLVLYILHSILTIIPPINSDEALYWEHSRHLALGYYSHPPLTGWIIAIITNLIGISKYSIRLASILLHLGTIVVVYLLAFEISKSKIFSNISIIIYSLFPLSIFFLPKQRHIGIPKRVISFIKPVPLSINRNNYP